MHMGMCRVCCTYGCAAHAYTAVPRVRLQARGLARAREMEADETRRAAEEAGRGYEVAADELHRTVEQQRLQCNVLRQQMREALEQKQVLRGVGREGGGR